MTRYVKKRLRIAIVLCGLVPLTGCAALQPPAAPPASGGPTRDRVGYGDIGTRESLQIQANTEDFKELARIVTDKFLKSKVVLEWSANGRRPRLVVGHLVNNTDDENIRMSDIYDIIQNQLLQSGAVRILDSSAAEFDYIIKTELTSTHQYSKEGEELYHMTMQTKLFKLDGELTGQWSHEVKKIKEKRRIF
jgi:penicillin-binding protein activator